MRLLGLLSGLALACLVGTAAAENAQPQSEGAVPEGTVLDAKAALAISQQAVGRQLGAYTFRDRTGKPVRLSDYQGKPLVISMIYTSCYHTCPTITETVARAVKAAQNALGPHSFNTVSIGFDTRVDTPDAMRFFAKQHGADSLPGWEFLSSDPLTVARLSEDMGFVYYRSPRGFDHLTQTTLIDAEGRIHRQVYGETFDLPHFVEPLKDMVLGRAAAITSFAVLSDKIRLFCTVYDPASDSYRFNYSLFIEIGFGLLCLAFMAWMVFYAWRSSRTVRN